MKKSKITGKTPRRKLQVLFVMFLILVFGIAFFREFVRRTNQEIAGPGEIADSIILSGNPGRAPSGYITDTQLRLMQGMNYEDMKRQFNLQRDFCIYIEDANGKILLAKSAAKLDLDVQACRSREFEIHAK